MTKKWRASPQAGWKPLGEVSSKEAGCVVLRQLHHSEMEAAGGSGSGGEANKTKRKAEEGAMRQKTWFQDREGVRIDAEEM